MIIGKECTEEEIKVLISHFKRGKQYYIWPESIHLVDSIEEIYRGNGLSPDIGINICPKRVGTIEDRESQEEIVEQSHVDKEITEE